MTEHQIQEYIKREIKKNPEVENHWAVVFSTVDYPGPYPQGWYPQFTFGGLARGYWQKTKAECDNNIEILEKICKIKEHRTIQFKRVWDLPYILYTIGFFIAAFFIFKKLR